MKHRVTSNTSKRHQVFLSHANADKEVAQRIADELHRRGIIVWLAAYGLQFGDSIAEAIRDAISASDYLIVLLSPNSVNSVWVQKELAAALSRDLSARDITLLPVVIADCDIPLFLASYQYLDLRRDFEGGIVRLIEQISVAPEIDFSELDGRRFENLVKDLLSRLGFRSIERERAAVDLRVDIEASYTRLDPFGVGVTENWLVEVKFYRQARADLKSIRQLVEYLTRLPTRSKGLLVTNGQLTSAAKDWLNSAKAQSRVEIRVIDGTELKRLLLQHGDLVNRYFVKKNAGQQDE